MAVSFGCHCPERQKPVTERAWVVIARECNHSAFNGWRYEPSDWSEVFCLGCHALGRTKAKYVKQLKNGEISLGEPLHRGYRNGQKMIL